MGRQMAKSKFAWALVLLCACLLAWPPANGQTNPGQMRGPVAEVSSVIGAEDVLDVEVFDTPELSTATARVTESGDVNLPVLGPIQVAGLSPNEAALKIETELKTGKPTAIVAGALHFSGPRSVIALLQQRGYVIEQL